MQNMIKENKRGQGFMMFTKIDQFCDPKPPQSAKINNRYII